MGDYIVNDDVFEEEGQLHSSLLVQAGAPYFMTKEDLKMVAPMWSTFATKVRNDPKVCLSVGTDQRFGGRCCIPPGIALPEHQLQDTMRRDRSHPMHV